MSAAISKDGVRVWWASLTPDKRKMVMGAAGLALLLGVLYLFVSAGPKDPAHPGGTNKADVNLLTGSDARTLGLESVGAELREAQRKQRDLQGALDRLANQSSTKEDLKALSNQVAVLSEAVNGLRQDKDRRPTDVQPPTSGTATGPQAGGSAPTGPRPNPFEEPEVAVPPPTSAAGRPRNSGAEAGESINVKVFGEQAAAPAPTAKARSESIYIPAGSILKGVLLTGVDAPTGMQSKRDPIPALMRIKHEAILPNRFAADVRECFVIFGATGDLSTERALLRAETLSCVRNDGGVIEATIDAYAMGDDGKAGMRGRLVKRNGSLVAKAAFASFAEALSNIFRPVAIQGFNTSPGARTQFQAPDASEALEAAGYAGFGGAMHRLSQYFLDLADAIVPFVEIDAARQVEAVMLKGVSLEIRSART